MTILTRYILGELIKIFMITLGAFVMIYVLVDFFERIDNFIEAGAEQAQVNLLCHEGQEGRKQHSFFIAHLGM